MFKSGAWWAICDVCGHKYKSTEMHKRWDGLMVCKGDWEPDHPQKYLRIRQDKIAPDWVRSRPGDLYVGIVCYPWSVSAYSDLATADCAQADNVPTSFAFLSDLKNAYPG